MKILHSSDWHLGKKLGPWSRLEEQKEVLEEIACLCESEDPHLIILAGDLYDSWNPPHEAIELLYRYLHRIADGGRRPVVALAGNHDAPEHVEAPDALARECGIFFLGYPESRATSVELPGGLSADYPDPGIIRLKGGRLDREVRIIATPYASETRMRRFLSPENREEELRRILKSHWNDLAEKHFDPEGINLMAAHLYMGQKGVLLEEEEPEGERSVLHPGGLEQIYTDALPSSCQYMALGHLHRGFPVQNDPVPAVYSGSPAAYSMTEKSESKSVVLIEAEPGKKAKFRYVSLKSPWPLYRMEFTDPDEAVDWLAGHQEGYVELTMRMKDYLTGTEKQKIMKSHKRILSIIPLVESESPEEGKRRSSFTGKSVKDIFKDYYRFSRQNAEAPEELLSLLDEVLAGKGGDTP